MLLYIIIPPQHKPYHTSHYIPHTKHLIRYRIFQTVDVEHGFKTNPSRSPCTSTHALIIITTLLIISPNELFEHIQIICLKVKEKYFGKISRK